MPGASEWLGALLALLLPGLALWPWRHWLAPGARGMGVLLWLCPAGWGILGAGLFLCGLMGLPLTVPSGLGILTVCALSQVLCGGKGAERASPPSAARALPPDGQGAWRRSVCVWLFSLSLSAPLLWAAGSVALLGSWHVPCVSVWGAKVQMIMETGSLPWRLWEADAVTALHPEYTLSWPLLLAWGQGWQAGAYDPVSIKICGLLLAFWTGLQIHALSREAGLGPAASTGLALALCGGAVAQQLAMALYAENLQLALLLTALRLGGRARQHHDTRLWLATGLTLGLAASIKQEGLLYVLLLTPLLLWRHPQGWAPLRRTLVPALLLGAGAQLALPRLLGWASVDFSLAEFHPQGLWLALQESVMQASCQGSYAWNGLPLELLALAALFWLLRHGTVGSGRADVWLAAALPAIALIILIHLAFIFSTRELAWHVQALDRLWHLSLGLAAASLLTLRRRA